MKIGIITLGCKVNQYESFAIGEELKKLGYEVSFELSPCDIYILNTCAVTGIAEKKSREFLARIKKQNSNAKVIVCGCASEHNAEQFLTRKNVSAVIGTSGKNKIAQILDKVGDLKTQMTSQYENFVCNTTSRTRAYLKIQDGCNNFCSYCLIPYVRGRSRSRSLEDIVSEAKSLESSNKEIILTGINMSDFQINGKLALADLLTSLKDLKCRIRISSLEVNVIDKTLLDVMKSMQNFCPQFHLSMQSGCDRILKLMNRHYTKEQFLAKIKLIRSYFPNASITTDVIVGFPTETDDDFAETLQTIIDAKFFEMHIFPYSKRDGTVASTYKMCDGNVVNKRVAILQSLNKKNRFNYISAQKNNTLTCLTENMQSNNVIGYTENYIKVYLPSETPLKQLVKVCQIVPYKDGAKGILA